MTKLLIAAIVLLMWATFAYSDEALKLNESCQNSDNAQVAQRGCCSHHDGVCGCNGSNVTCCDGSFSPTCGCNANDINDFLKSNEAEQPKS